MKSKLFYTCPHCGGKPKHLSTFLMGKAKKSGEVKCKSCQTILVIDEAGMHTLNAQANEIKKIIPFEWAAIIIIIVTALLHYTEGLPTGITMVGFVAAGTLGVKVATSVLADAYLTFETQKTSPPLDGKPA